MNAWFESLDLLERIYLLLGGIGGGLFAVRFAMTLIGFGGDEGADADHGAGADHGADADHGAGDGDADQADQDSHDAHEMLSFKLLSFQGLTAFSMMFGIIGLAVSRGGFGSVTSLAAATAAGAAIVWVADKLFRFLGGLQESGTLDLRRAIKEEGTIYLTIPTEGVGKVRLTVDGRLRVLDAVSEDQSEIPTDSRVEVVSVVNKNVMVVKKV